MRYFLCVIGMLLIVEGLPYFVVPEKMKEFTGRILDMKENSMRQFGLLLMVIGLVLVYLGRC